MMLLLVKDLTEIFYNDAQKKSSKNGSSFGFFDDFV